MTQSDFRGQDLLKRLWLELLSGALKVESTPKSDGYELLLLRSEAQPTRSAGARRAECGDAALRGRTQKAIAMDLGVAPATIAAILKQVSEGFGVSGRFSQVPVALPLLAHAVNGAPIVARCELDEAEPAQHMLLSISSLDNVLADTLSSSEREVMRGYLSGKSHTQIAAARRTSHRTIANQLAGSFRTLQASGRFGVIAALVHQSAAQGTPLTLTLSAPRPPRRMLHQRELAQSASQITPTRPWHRQIAITE